MIDFDFKLKTRMPDLNALPSLVVSGVSLLLKHRFVVLWPQGIASSFPEWDQLKAHLREKDRSDDPDVMQARVFVYSREWAQVEHPGCWQLQIEFFIAHLP